MRSRRHSLLRLTAALCIVLLSAARTPGQEKKLLTFDQIFRNGEPRITTALPAVAGWKDDGHFVETPRGEGRPGTNASFLVDAASGRREPYRDMEPYRKIVGEEIDPAAPAASDESYTHLLYEKEGDFYLLNTATKEFSRLTRSPGERKNPEFSPDGKFVAFTLANNLWSVEIATGKERRYTQDGSDVVYNGWASWVYFEEILRRASHYRAFWWSPDGSRIAFFRFDDSRVPVVPLVNSAGQHGAVEYTRYPEAGDPNPAVKVGIVPAEGGPVVWSAFDAAGDQYFGTPFWTPEGKSLWVQWMNRRQDTLRVFAVDPRTGEKRPVYEESQKSWVEWLESVRFVRDGFIIKSDRDGWTHLYMYDREGRLRSRPTEGRWSVNEIQAVDERSGRIFFTGRKEASTRTDLYSVNFDGSGLTRLTFGPFTHTVSVSPAGTYFVTTYSNVGTPPRMALYTGAGKLVREMGDSRGKEFDGYRLGKTELFTIRTPDGYDLPAVWTLPPQFDPSKKYPVLISEYGGPGSESVSDGWRGIGPEWLAEEGLIQFSVDHRGSGHFGKEGISLMYRNLGKWEMHDYAEAVRWLRSKPFVDSARICITGGSYGGYVTCLALTEEADYFPFGVALFPVTDWQLYDTHYVERYMGRPAENPEGYRDGSVLTYADRYRGLLRIVHGTIDDNVHMQNSLQLIDRFEDLGKHFEFMAYPGERHGWRGKKMVHLRNETYRFYYTNLLRKEFPEKLFESAPPAGGRMR